jgi:hypothetical protein
MPKLPEIAKAWRTRSWWRLMVKVNKVEEERNAKMTIASTSNDGRSTTFAGNGNGWKPWSMKLFWDWPIRSGKKAEEEQEGAPMAAQAWENGEVCNAVEEHQQLEEATLDLWENFIEIFVGHCPLLNISHIHYGVLHAVTSCNVPIPSLVQAVVVLFPERKFAARHALRCNTITTLYTVMTHDRKTQYTTSILNYTDLMYDDLGTGINLYGLDFPICLEKKIKGSKWYDHCLLPWPLYNYYVIYIHDR